MRVLTGALLSVFLFVTLAPTTFADATNRNEGFYDQTFEIGNRISSKQGSQTGSSSGAYVFSLPLNVPAGRNGLQPSLSLSYNSQGGEVNSFYGYGWSLDLPSISRMNKTGLNNLYSETNFSSSLSGELVSISGSPYGDYGAKVESGAYLDYVFNSSDDSWTVTDKSGTVYTFGSTADSRQDNPSDSTEIYKWMLEEIRDTNDNYLRYEYFKENGQIYPESISYTGNGATDGIFLVEFGLESRSDPSSFYSTGFEVQTDYRVSGIEVSIDGTLRKSYGLTYTTPDNTTRSLLKSVTESGVSETGVTTTLPATTFDYAQSSKGWSSVNGYTIPVYFYFSGDHSDKGNDVADVNGDGLLDIIDSGLYSGSTGVDSVYLNNGDGSGWSEDSSYTVGVRFWDNGKNQMRNTRMTDINGDGFSDILYGAMDSTTDARKTYIFDEDTSTWVEDSAYSLPIRFNDGYLDDLGVRLLDVNGDGYSDYVQSLIDSSGAQQSLYLFDPETQTWNVETSYSIPVAFNDRSSNTDEGVSLGEVNGDGLVDIIKSRYDGSTQQAVYLNNGDGTGWTQDTGYSIPVYFWESSGILSTVAQLMDVDGDRLADIVHSDASHSDVYINRGNGTGWAKDTAYTVPVDFALSYGSPEGVQSMDVDGDNFVDFVQSKQSGGTTTQRVYVSNASPELLETVHSYKGSTTTVSYSPSTEFDNPNLPFAMNLVDSITVDDGLGDSSTTTFDYEGGAYLYEDELNRQFAGFSSITKTEDGRETETFYEQDDLALLGHAYQSDVYDESGNLYTRSIDTWASSDLGYDNDFVYKSKSATLTYDGGSSHRDTGTAYTYDSNGNVKTVINYGEVTASLDGTFTDDTTLDEKTTLTYTYATDGSGGEIRNKVAEEKVTNSAGTVIKKTRYFYDSNSSYATVSTGNLFRQADWYDATNGWYNSYYTYNSYGLVATAKNRRWYTTSFTYDAYNLYPAVTTNPKTYTVSTEYDYATGQMTSRTDENGITSESTYDGLGRVLTVSVPDPTTGVLTTLSTTSYDDTSVPSSVSTTSTVGGVTSESVTYIDGYGRTVQSNTLAEDGLYTTVDTWYDSLGNVQTQSLPYSTSSSAYGRDDSQYGVSTSYDPLNRPLTVTAPTGSTSYDYSQWENTVTDANGISKVYNYDAAGRLLEVEEQNDGATYNSAYEYDPLGQLLTLTDSQGNERNFDYDSLGRKISQEDLHDPTETTFGTWRYTYDANNNLLTQTDPKGQVITWAYDLLDRVSYEDWDMSTTARDFNYLYDSGTRGRMKIYRVNSNNQDISVYYNSYDFLGNPTKESHSYKNPGLATYSNYIFLKTYDLLSRETKVTYPFSVLTVNTTYNATGAIEKITRGTSTLSNVISDIDYTPAGQVSSMTYANGVVTTNSYDPAESYRLTNKTTTGSYGGVSGNIQNLAYSYDAVGNITGIADTSITPTAKTITYTYDDLNRLLSSATSGLSAGDYTETYTYDSVGNLTYKSNVGTLTYAGTGAAANPHAVTDVAGTAYTYDANGNMTSDGTNSYTWDKRNRMTGSGSLAFSYNADGSRYRTADSSSGTTVYNYYLSPYEEIRNGVKTYYIFAGSQRVASLVGTTYTYYHNDHLGGTALTTDSTGAVTQVYDYYPYGSELINNQIGTSEIHHSFTDKELEDALGLYYFEARWYDGDIGRFGSLDPAQLDNRVFKLITDPQSLNFYAYSRNNPINLVDPSGEVPEWLKNAGQNVLRTLDTVPVTGDISDVYSAITGTTLFSQEELTPEERAMTAIAGLVIGATGGQIRLADDIIETVESAGTKVGTRNIDGGTTNADEILNGAENWLGNGYKEIDEGVFRSADDSRQFRMTDNDLTDPKQGPHTHFESVGQGGSGSVENSHVYLED